MKIKITIESSDDCRKLFKILDEEEQEHFTFKLAEEQSVRVVIRGIREVT